MCDKKMEIKRKKYDISQKEIISIINSAPVYVLLQIGRRVASTDYAVRFYYNKNYTKFYKNIDKLRYAIRRSISIGGASNKTDKSHVKEYCFINHRY